MQLKNLKVALVYDRVNKFGGAERVLLALHEIFSDAPIYTLVHDKKGSEWAKDIKITPTFLNKVPFLRKKHELLVGIAPLAFETFKLNKYDLVISVTSESAKSVLTKPGTLHLCYCLTPTRYLWSGSGEYQTNPGMGIISPLVKSLLHRFTNWLQKRDLILSKRPDVYLAISKEVQKRIKNYYDQPSDLVYPPIDYSFWSKKGPKSNQSKSYYLVVSRLVPYKKVDLVIKAFNDLPNKKLLIVGTGSQLSNLKRLATKNTSFLGSVSDTRLRELYLNAKAVIFPQAEDFGLVPLEAQATGTPVLAYKKSGALETIKEGSTGLFFQSQTKEGIINAIQTFERGKHRISAKHCRENAANFSLGSFKKQFSGKVETLWQQHQKTIM